MHGWKGLHRATGAGATSHFKVGVVLGMALAGCAAPVAAQRLRMDGLQLTLAKVSSFEDPLEQEKVEYLTTGKSQYDEFFRSSAEVRASLVVSEALSRALTTNLKSFARSYAAAGANDESVRIVVGSTPLDQLSEEQSIALLALKKKKGDLSTEEATFAVNSVTNTGQTVAFLTRASGNAKVLADQGGALSKSVKDDFTGVDSAKVPTVARGLTASVENVKAASAKAPELARNLARLGEGLKTLL